MQAASAAGLDAALKSSVRKVRNAVVPEGIRRKFLDISRQEQGG